MDQEKIHLHWYVPQSDWLSQIKQSILTFKEVDLWQVIYNI